MKQRFELSRHFNVSLDSYGGNQMWFKNKYMLRTGCGPVALANLYAWFNQMSLSRDEMEALQAVASQSLKGPVVLPQQFIFGAKRLFKRDTSNLSPLHMTLVRSNQKNRNRAFRFIAASLKSDNPVALLMGPNVPGTTYRPDFKNHWVLITSLQIFDARATLSVSSWGTLYEVDWDQLTQSKLFLSLVSLRAQEPTDRPVTHPTE